MAQKQRGFSLIELLVAIAIILIIAAIVIPNLLISRQRANEAAAVSTLRTLNTSEATYNTSYGDLVGYANRLVLLGPSTTTCDQTHACLIDNLLACASEPCLRGAYNYFATSDSGSAPFLNYAITATPLTFNGTGTRNFCTSEEGTVRFQVGGNASLTSPVLPSVCINFATYDSL